MDAVDSIDSKILNMLIKNSRLSSREIGRALSLSPPAVSKRIKRMELNGIIKGYTIQVGDDNLLDFLILCRIDGEGARKIIESSDGVAELYSTAGSCNLVVDLKVENREGLAKFAEKFRGGHGEILSIYPVLSHKILPGYRSGNEYTVRCSYCKNEIAGKPFKLKTASGTRYFCCKVCRREYLKKYRRGSD